MSEPGAAVGGTAVGEGRTAVSETSGASAPWQPVSSSQEAKPKRRREKKPFIGSYQLSAISYELSAMSYQLSCKLLANS
jgi:hypothetical protein